MDIQAIAGVVTQMDKEVVVLYTGMIVFLVKVYFNINNKIESLSNEINILKEKAIHVEKDITMLEATHYQHSNDLKSYLQYVNGRIVTPKTM